jgi:hypothetical protein
LRLPNVFFAAGATLVLLALLAACASLTVADTVPLIPSEMALPAATGSQRSPPQRRDDAFAFMKRQ